MSRRILTTKNTENTKEEERRILNHGKHGRRRRKIPNESFVVIAPYSPRALLRSNS
jgi:hypothetical protein